MRSLVLAISLLLYSCNAGAQDQTIETIIVHNQCELEGNGICPSGDGGLIVTGRCDDCYKESQLSSLDKSKSQVTEQEMREGAFIARLDQQGKLVWIQSIRGISSKRVLPTADGNFMVTGFIPGYREELYNGDRTQGIWAGKYSPDGQEIWWKILKSNYNSTASDMWMCGNGDALILGDKESPGEGYIRPEQGRLVRIDADGTLLWDRQVGGFGSFYAYSIIENKDGSIMVAGAEPAGGLTKHKMAIYKLDHMGKHQWYQSYVWPKSEYSNENNWAYSVTECKNDGYIVAGVAHYNPKEYRLLRIDADGKKLWSEVYPGDIFDPPHVVQTNDGGFILGGIAEVHPETLEWKPEKHDDSDFKSSIYVVKTDAQGKEIWKRSYAYGKSPSLTEMSLDKRGNILITGRYRETEKVQLNSKDYYLENRAKGIYVLRLNQEGKLK